MSESDNVPCEKCQCDDTRKVIEGCNIEKEEKPFYSHALGKRVEGKKDWIRQAKAKGWNTDILDPY